MAALNPYLVPLTISIASSNVSYSIIATTGPKISSCANSLSGLISVKIVGA